MQRGNAPSSPLFDTMAWGMVHEEVGSLHNRPIISHCLIGKDYYATCDGSMISLWKPPNDVVHVEDIQAVALFFIPKLSQVVAYVNNSHQLHFLGSKHPFQLRIHPFHFSDKSISSFFYFTKTSTLVSAGNGLLFTFVNIPPYFKDAKPMPETLQFEKLCLLFENVVFDKDNKPYFCEDNGTVVLKVNNEVHILTSNGIEVQIIRCFEQSDVISSISLLPRDNYLVAGMESGKVMILKFELPNPFVPNAPPDSCRNLSTFEISNSKIILSELFDRNFLLSVDSQDKITVCCLKKNKILQGIMHPASITVCFFGYNRLIVFSQFNITSYKCMLFLSHFCDVSSDAFDIIRSPSESRSARFVSFLKNYSVLILSAKEGRQIIGFKSSLKAPTIRNICYARDIEVDGSNIIKRVVEDIFYCQLDHGFTAFLEFDRFDKTLTPSKNDPFYPTVPAFETAWIPTTISDDSVLNIFVAFLDIGEGQVCGIDEGGTLYIFSSSATKLIASFSMKEEDIICACYSFTSKLLIVSAINKLFTFNLKSRTIVSCVNDCMITSLLMIDSSTLFCGCANGFVEVRTFPGLKLKINSQYFNACHTDKGHRTPLPKNFLTTRQLYDIPSVVKKLDFCPQRDTVLSLSVGGEIFLWEKNGKPIKRITFPFKTSSACFADGNGSIIISALDLFLKIKWKYLFKKHLLPFPTPLDDFNLKLDFFDIKHMKKREPPIIKPVPKEERDQFMEIMFDSAELEEPFQELIVDFESLPKRHFVQKPKEDVAPKDDIIYKPVKLHIPLNNIDDLLEKENQKKLKMKDKNQDNLNSSKKLGNTMGINTLSNKSITFSKKMVNQFASTTPRNSSIKANNKFETKPSAVSSPRNSNSNTKVDLNSGPAHASTPRRSGQSSKKTAKQPKTPKLGQNTVSPKKKTKMRSKKKLHKSIKKNMKDTMLLENPDEIDGNSNNQDSSKTPNKITINQENIKEINKIQEESKFNLEQSEINESSNPLSRSMLNIPKLEAPQISSFRSFAPTTKPLYRDEVNNKNNSKNEVENHSTLDSIQFLGIEQANNNLLDESLDNVVQNESSVNLNSINRKNEEKIENEKELTENQTSTNKNEISINLGGKSTDLINNNYLKSDAVKAESKEELGNPENSDNNKNTYRIDDVMDVKSVQTDLIEQNVEIFEVREPKTKSKKHPRNKFKKSFMTEPEASFEDDHDQYNAMVEEKDVKPLRKSFSKFKSESSRRIWRMEKQIDDSIFTNYKIDGFKQPFGGYRRTSSQGVKSVGANAPLVSIESAGEVKMGRSRGVFVTRVTHGVRMTPNPGNTTLIKTINQL